MIMHPYMNELLVEQRRRSCPCGAQTARPGTLCSKCRHTALWRRHKRQAKHGVRTVGCTATRHAPSLLAVLAALIAGRW
jgi:hypothetical protein